MKLYINSDFECYKVDGNQVFVQGNDNVNKIEVEFNHSDVMEGNCYCAFSFLLPNGRKIGEIVSTGANVVDDVSVTYYYNLTNVELQMPGTVLCTISIKFYDANNIVVRTKRINVQFTVSKAVMIMDDVYYTSPENVDNKDFLASVMKTVSNMEAKVNEHIVANKTTAEEVFEVVEKKIIPLSESDIYEICTE